MDKITSGKVAQFTKETKEAIFKRDGYKCILCTGTFLLDPHHVFYGPEAQVCPGRNDVDQGVTLCRECHLEKVHICRRGQGEREECINYVINYYGKDKKTTDG